MFLLLIHELGHSAMYFLLAILAFHLLKKKFFPWIEVFVGYIVTIGLDMDHFFDYFLYFGLSPLKFNFNDFLHSNHFTLSGKIYIPFHAWEWFIVFMLVYYITKKKHSVLVFIAVGIAAQLIFDTLSYGFDPRVYSIIYRALHNFTQSIFIPVLY